MTSDAVYQGFAKVRLVHAKSGSLILVDHVFIDGPQHYWLQPHFLYAPVLTLDDPARTEIWVSVANRWDEDVLLRLEFTEHDFTASLSDMSQIYRCRVHGTRRLHRYKAGASRRRSDNGFDLLLYHHTTKQAKKEILKSGHLRCSQWNYAGTRELTNCGYAYFTSLDRLESERDLQRVAMSGVGQKWLRLDQTETEKADVVLDVYREQVDTRSARLSMWIPAEHIAPSHVWEHTGFSATSYETTHPWIFRVGLKPGHVYPFAGNKPQCPDGSLKRFGSVIVGDCTTKPGLRAPFDEEVTSSTFEIQPLGTQTLFSYWRSHANRPLFQNSLDVPETRTTGPSI